MNTFEVSSITFIVGIAAGAFLEWKYGAKVAASVDATAKADIATLKTDVAELKAKAQAALAKV